MDSTNLPLTSEQGLSEDQVPSLKSTRSDRIVASIQPIVTLANALGIVNHSGEAWNIALPDGENFVLSPGLPTRLVDGMLVDFGQVWGQVCLSAIAPNTAASLAPPASAATLAATTPTQTPPPAPASQDDVNRSGSEWVTVPSRKPANLLVRLWRGQISLPVTYWLWGVVGGIIALVAVQAVKLNASTRAPIYAAAIVTCAWQGFVSVAIFRSGGKHAKTKGKFWGRLAQVIACLGLLAGVSSLVQISRDQEDWRSMDAEIASENARLPKMLDKITRLDNVSRDSRTLTYQYTVLGPTHVPSSQEIRQWVAESCRDAGVRSILNRFDKAIYIYRNKAGSVLYRIELTKADCR